MNNNTIDNCNFNFPNNDWTNPYRATPWTPRNVKRTTTTKEIYDSNGKLKSREIITVEEEIDQQQFWYDTTTTVFGNTANSLN